MDYVFKKPTLEKMNAYNQHIACQSKKEDKNESYTDFMCPICLQLLIKPVVLPCKHELCMPCFSTHVEETSLCCPMCRVRISNWARKKARQGSLVDEERWKQIQMLFPERCIKRLNGEDDDDDDDIFQRGSNFVPKVAEEGELRKEYEKELEKAEIEKQEELKASEEILREIQEEERAQQEELEQDELMAKQLQKEELQNFGGKLKSPNSKLTELLDVFKLPQEMNLRSNFASKSKDGQASRKRKSSLTNWLSKTSQGTSELADANLYSEQSTFRSPVKSQQEQEDFDMALKLQRELDTERKHTPNLKTLDRHFHPLRQRSSDDSSPSKNKRFRTK